MRDADADLLIALETGLQTPSGRRDLSQLEDLLHADYQELGLSGKLWTRAQVIDALIHEAEPRRISASDFKLHVTGELEAVLTYRTCELKADGEPARWARRRSVWRRDAAHANWRIVSHEALPDNDGTGPALPG